jgi:hypothetical protein
MPTDFEPDPPRRATPQRKWGVLVAVALVLLVALALVGRQHDRTTGMAPDKAPSEKTIGLAPQK